MLWRNVDSFLKLGYHKPFTQAKICVLVMSDEFYKKQKYNFVALLTMINLMYSFSYNLDSSVI